MKFLGFIILSLVLNVACAQDIPGNQVPLARSADMESSAGSESARPQGSETGNRTAGLTRHQVYEQLVQARKSGEIRRLNETLYNGGS
ncbi:DUF4148 domain-containing protein [Burkholderia catarinensis]|uniref:DUF4148 domain-containing protein n=1 Tax=Burkholderia catarinensis TaxID=1108140 RepID=UPI00100849E3|nr:DUF4148 domain-containing protein [Burkholderia catarinensis]